MNVVAFNFNQVNVCVVNDSEGNPWFVAADVASILDYSEASAMTRHLDADERRLSNDRPWSGTDIYRYQRVWSVYRNDIKIVALVHDAIYLMILDDVEVVEFANNELIRSMEWQELPEIQHDQVKIGAALDLFYQNGLHQLL